MCFYTFSLLLISFLCPLRAQLIDGHQLALALIIHGLGPNGKAYSAPLTDWRATVMRLVLGPSMEEQGGQDDKAIPVMVANETQLKSLLPISVYAPSSGQETSCQHNADCYDLREPNEWCLLSKEERYYEKGCFCEATLLKCVIERQEGPASLYTDCTKKSISLCELFEEAPATPEIDNGSNATQAPGTPATAQPAAATTEAVPTLNLTTPSPQEITNETPAVISQTPSETESLPATMPEANVTESSPGVGNVTEQPSAIESTEAGTVPPEAIEPNVTTEMEQTTASPSPNNVTGCPPVGAATPANVSQPCPCPNATETAPPTATPPIVTQLPITEGPIEEETTEPTGEIIESTGAAAGGAAPNITAEGTTSAMEHVSEVETSISHGATVSPSAGGLPVTEYPIEGLPTVEVPPIDLFPSVPSIEETIEMTTVEYVIPTEPPMTFPVEETETVAVPTMEPFISLTPEAQTAEPTGFETSLGAAVPNVTAEGTTIEITEPTGEIIESTEAAAGGPAPNITAEGTTIEMAHVSEVETSISHGATVSPSAGELPMTEYPIEGLPTVEVPPIDLFPSVPSIEETIEMTTVEYVVPTEPPMTFPVEETETVAVPTMEPFISLTPEAQTAEPTGFETSLGAAVPNVTAEGTTIEMAHVSEVETSVSHGATVSPSASELPMTEYPIEGLPTVEVPPIDLFPSVPSIEETIEMTTIEYVVPTEPPMTFPVEETGPVEGPTMEPFISLTPEAQTAEPTEIETSIGAVVPNATEMVSPAIPTEETPTSEASTVGLFPTISLEATTAEAENVTGFGIIPVQETSPPSTNVTEPLLQTQSEEASTVESVPSEPFPGISLEVTSPATGNITEGENIPVEETYFPTNVTAPPSAPSNVTIEGLGQTEEIITFETFPYVSLEVTSPATGNITEGGITPIGGGAETPSVQFPSEEVPTVEVVTSEPFPLEFTSPGGVNVTGLAIIGIDETYVPTNVTATPLAPSNVTSEELGPTEEIVTFEPFSEISLEITSPSSLNVTELQKTPLGANYSSPSNATEELPVEANITEAILPNITSQTGEEFTYSGVATATGFFNATEVPNVEETPAEEVTTPESPLELFPYSETTVSIFNASEFETSGVSMPTENQTAELENITLGANETVTGPSEIEEPSDELDALTHHNATDISPLIANNETEGFLPFMNNTPAEVIQNVTESLPLAVLENSPVTFDQANMTERPLLGTDMQNISDGLFPNDTDSFSLGTSHSSMAPPGHVQNKAGQPPATQTNTSLDEYAEITTIASEIDEYNKPEQTGGIDIMLGNVTEVPPTSGNATASPESLPTLDYESLLQLP